MNKYVVTVYKNGSRYEKHVYSDIESANAAAERLENKYEGRGMDVEVKKMERK